MATLGTVRELLAVYPPDVRKLALAACRLVMQAAPQTTEMVDPSANVIGYGYGPGYKQLIFTLILSQGGVKIGVVRGSELPAPRGLLRGSGKVHRHVELRNPADLKQPGLRPLLRAAMALGNGEPKATPDIRLLRYGRQAVGGLSVW